MGARTGRCLLAGFFLILAGGALTSDSAQSPAAAEGVTEVEAGPAPGIHVDADGTVYKVDEEGVVHQLDPGELGAGEPVQGAVEPELLREAAREPSSQREVVVFVKAAVPRGSPTAQQIKSLHLPGVEAAAEEIRAIERKHRPLLSLAEDEERAHVAAQGALERVMDAADRERLQDARSRLDGRLDPMRKAVGRTSAVASPADRQAVADFIAAGGGIVEEAAGAVASIRATIPSGLLPGLGAHPLVAMVVKFRPGQLETDVSIPSVGFPAWWNAPRPLCGGIFDFGLIDSSIAASHLTSSARVAPASPRPTSRPRSW